MLEIKEHKTNLVQKLELWSAIIVHFSHLKFHWTQILERFVMAMAHMCIFLDDDIDEIDDDDSNVDDDDDDDSNDDDGDYVCFCHTVVQPALLKIINTPQYQYINIYINTNQPW